MINCSFSTVHERDMDILFLEALVSDQGLTELVLSKTGFSGQAFLVLSGALSETEPDLGRKRHYHRPANRGYPGRVVD